MNEYMGRRPAGPPDLFEKWSPGPSTLYTRDGRVSMTQIGLFLFMGRSSRIRKTTAQMGPTHKNIKKTESLRISTKNLEI